MAKYKVYMVKLGRARVGSEANVGTALKGYIDAVITSNAGLRRRYADGSEINWLTRCPTPAAHELLIYVVVSAVDSIVNSLPGLRSGPAGLGHDGLTVWVGNLTASEVYTARFGSNAAMMAKLAFHEAMHNKTHRGRTLHSGNGLAASPVTGTSTLTRANKAMMARVLARSRPQWAGGCTAYNDPLRGMGSP